MPKLSFEIKQTKNAPTKQLGKDGGTQQNRKMIFAATFEDVDFKMSIKGTKTDIHDLFGNWPLEVGQAIQLTLNSKLSQTTLTNITQPVEEEDETEDLQAFEQEIKELN